MRLIQRAYLAEYRDAAGQDHCTPVDIWLAERGHQAVLVFRDLPDPSQAGRAFHSLAHELLPYLLPPETELVLLALKSGDLGTKPRAQVLPPSAQAA